MREIKFRAWDEKNEVMHHDFEFIKSGNDGNDWIIFTSDKHTLAHKPHPFEDPFFQQQLIIMEYTGLRDKNGKEIYEGDIVVRDSYPYFDEGKPNYVSVVEWCFAGFHTVLCCINPDKMGISDGINEPLEEDDAFEVIGNIYENVGLMDKSQKKK